MNAYVYFANRTRTFPEIQPEHRTWFARAWLDLQNANLPSSKMEELLLPVVKELSLPDEDGSAVKEAFYQKLKQYKEEKSGWVREYADVFAFLLLYAGLYQGLFVCIADPLLQQESPSFVMPIGWGLLIQSLLLYCLCKTILQVFCLPAQNWKRWLMLGGGFLLYMGGLYGLKKLDSGRPVSIWLVLLVCTAAAGICHVWLCRSLELFRFRPAKEAVHESCSL